MFYIVTIQPCIRNGRLQIKNLGCSQNRVCESLVVVSVLARSARQYMKIKVVTSEGLHGIITHRLFFTIEIQIEKKNRRPADLNKET